MNENTLNKVNFINKIVKVIKSNIRLVLIIFSLSFIIFLSFQIYSFYNLKKIQNNSVVFFNSQNVEEFNQVKDLINKLSKENNFYGILSKLELIQIDIKKKKYQNVIDLYKELLENNSLNNIYKSAIASKASYEFIDINLNDINKDYSQELKYFVSFVDEKLVNYNGIKLELNYLIKILDSKKNNIEYLNYEEAIILYEKIINAEYTSSNTKERINKIHEFYSNN